VGYWLFTKKRLLKNYASPLLFFFLFFLPFLLHKANKLTAWKKYHPYWIKGFQMKVKFIILTAFISPVFVSAQAFQIDKPALPIDSLQKVLPLLRSSARVDCLNELTCSYSEADQIDSAFLYAMKAYTEASAINYIKGLGDACLRYGILCQWFHSNDKEAKIYFQQAVGWYKQIGNYE
jgi:hypothetical protein